jgi:hypothetical protein
MGHCLSKVTGSPGHVLIRGKQCKVMEHMSMGPESHAFGAKSVQASQIHVMCQLEESLPYKIMVKFSDKHCSLVFKIVNFSEKVLQHLVQKRVGKVF